MWLGTLHAPLRLIKNETFPLIRNKTEKSSQRSPSISTSNTVARNKKNYTKFSFTKYCGCGCTHIYEERVPKKGKKNNNTEMRKLDQDEKFSLGIFALFVRLFVSHAQRTVSHENHGLTFAYAVRCLHFIIKSSCIVSGGSLSLPSPTH